MYQLPSCFLKLASVNADCCAGMLACALGQASKAEMLIWCRLKMHNLTEWQLGSRHIWLQAVSSASEVMSCMLLKCLHQCSLATV